MRLAELSAEFQGGVLLVTDAPTLLGKVWPGAPRDASGAQHRVDNEQTMSNALDLIAPWLQGRGPAFDARGIQVSLTWGPSEWNPASAWLDFETGSSSARLILWSNGLAELTVGNLSRKEVLLEEHREITSNLGLDDAAETIFALFE